MLLHNEPMFEVVLVFPADPLTDIAISSCADIDSSVAVGALFRSDRTDVSFEALPIVM
jgi:hypothetical protein